MASDYTTVTEAPGVEVTQEAVRIIYSRYSFALSYCQNKDVLEVACGGGLGLGLLVQKASRLVAGDYTAHLLSQAARNFGDRVPLILLDAHHLPFEAQSFDVIILYEALYYLSDPRAFLKECRRVLKPGGTVLISTVNKEHHGFASSPFSVAYFSAQELKELLVGAGFEADVFGSFASGEQALKSAVTLTIRRLAVTLNLIPKTMKAKAVFKRLFYGPLTNLPQDIAQAGCEFEPWTLLREPWGDAFRYKFLCSAARLAHR